MDYLNLIKRFWRMDEKFRFSGNETRLYFYLLKVFNAEGIKKDWPDTLNIMDPILCTGVNMSLNNMKPCRKVLEDAELIEVKTVGKGRRVGTEYRLLDGSNSSKRMSDFDNLSGEECQKEDQNLTFFETGNQEECQKECQKDCQKESQKESQNLTTFLYIDKPNLPDPPNLPNPQTKKEGGALDEVDFDSKKNGVESVRRDPFTFKSDSEKTNVPFSRWFDAYQKNVGKDLCRVVWLELSDDERETAMKHTPPYVQSKPDKSKQKDPFNYLTLKTFNDEIIERHAGTKNSQRSGSRIPIKEESTGDLRSGFNRRRTPDGGS